MFLFSSGFLRCLQERPSKKKHIFIPNSWGAIADRHNPCTTWDSPNAVCHGIKWLARLCSWVRVRRVPYAISLSLSGHDIHTVPMFIIQLEVQTLWVSGEKLCLVEIRGSLIRMLGHWTALETEKIGLGLERITAIQVQGLRHDMKFQVGEPL